MFRCFSFVFVATWFATWASFAQAAPVAPIVHYSFDDNSNLFADSSGNGFTATPTGSPIQTGTSAFGAGALALDGTSQYITLPGGITSFFAGQAATMSVWVKLNTPGPMGIQGSLDTLGTNNSHFPWTNAQGYFGEFRSTRVDGVVLGISDFSQWHNVVITNDPVGGANPDDRWRMYVDGVERINVAPEAWSFLGFQVGRNNNNNYINGSIDEFQLFNVALSATQVQNLFTINASDPPPPPPPLTPEPASLALFATVLGAAALRWYRHRPVV